MVICLERCAGLHMAQLMPLPLTVGRNGGNVTSAGWQVTLCDSVWHVSSRSGVATLRTAIHLLLTYLLSLAPIKSRLVLPFWYLLTWVVPDKGPLNVCVCYRLGALPDAQPIVSKHSRLQLL